jgi:hypothetical protein
MAFPQSYPKFRALLADGSPAAGYKLYTYAAGTLTPAATYTDQTEGAANANPVVLDANGEAAVWLRPSVAYKFILKTDADVDVWTLDAINSPEGGYFSTLNVTGAVVIGGTASIAGQLTMATGSGVAPLVITSGAAKVANLDADKLDGGDWLDVPDNGAGDAIVRAKRLNALVAKTYHGTGSNLSGPDIRIEPDDGQAGGVAKGGDIILRQSTTDDALGTPGNIQEVGRASTLEKLMKTVEGAQWVRGYITEEITLNTGAAATDSVGNLLPANALIEAVVYRITQTITTAANFTVGDSAQAARFLGTQSTLTAGTTGIGLLHHNPANATNDLGPVQSAAAKLRITCNAAPGAGKIRVTVFYRRFIAPTS